MDETGYVAAPPEIFSNAGDKKGALLTFALVRILARLKIFCRAPDRRISYVYNDSLHEWASIGDCILCIGTVRLKEEAKLGLGIARLCTLVPGVAPKPSAMGFN